METTKLHKINRVGWSLIYFAGIGTEQLIHIPGLRNIFGTTIGEFSGDFTLGTQVAYLGLVSTGLCYMLTKNRRLSLALGAATSAFALGALIANERSIIPPGSGQTLDLVAAFFAIIATNCAAEAAMHAKNLYFTG